MSTSAPGTAKGACPGAKHRGKDVADITKSPHAAGTPAKGLGKGTRVKTLGHAVGADRRGPHPIVFASLL
jgi:hypothetical protein